MKLKPIKRNMEEYPEAVIDYMRDSVLYDSSSSPQARVIFIDKNDGYFLKEAAEGTLRTEALMTAYLHSLKLSDGRERLPGAGSDPDLYGGGDAWTGSEQL